MTTNGILGLLLMVAPLFAQPAAKQVTPEVADAQIEKWITDLDSNRFFERRNATESLIQLGVKSIDPVTKAVQSGSLETIARGIYILRELASSTTFETETQAFQALEKIAERKVTLAARRASTTLKGLGELRQKRAKEYLAKQGAILTEDYVKVTDLIPRSFPCVVFGNQWRGTVQDLSRLKWVTQQRSQPATVRIMAPPSKWLITLEGKKIDDQYLEALKGFAGIAAIKIRKTNISEAGLAHLADFKELLYLDLLYNPLTPEAIPHLSKLKTLSRFRLFGSKLPVDEVDKVKKALDQCEIDFREGGFLGISAKPNPPCRIDSIIPNSGADLAGLRPSDKIIAYGGQPVEDFSGLVKLIGDNAPGDTVDVVIDRLGEKSTVKVKLGEWK